jgi:hypothetical protein
MFRCLGRSATVANRLRAQRVKEQQKAPFRSQAQLLAQLEVRQRVQLIIAIKGSSQQCTHAAEQQLLAYLLHLLLLSAVCIAAETFRIAWSYRRPPASMQRLSLRSTAAKC